MTLVERTSPRRLFTATLGGLTLAAFGRARRVDAAAPLLMIVSGPPLAKRVIVTMWEENLAFIQGQKQPDVTPHGLARRPFFKVTMFWGAPWNTNVADGDALDDLSASNTTQRGRYYPRIGDALGRFVFEHTFGAPTMVTGVTKCGLQVLACHCVPTRFDDAGNVVASNAIAACPLPTTPLVVPITSPWS